MAQPQLRMPMNVQTLSSILGDRETGRDVRTANMNAVQSVANVLRTSLGPQGLDKMLVDDVGDVVISNDGATILRNIEVKHPAAKVLVDLSDYQDQEVGDGTTTVVLLAAEMLKRAHKLVMAGVHATVVIAGLKMAMKESVAYLLSNLSFPVDSLPEGSLENIARTSLASKFIGSEADYFAEKLIRAILGVKIVNDAGVSKYPVDSINLVKVHGKSSKESTFVEGYVLGRLGRAAQGMPTSVSNAKIALIDFNLRQFRMQLGVEICISDPNELEKVRKKEKDITKEKINKVLSSGANVVLCSQGIDDMSLKYFVEAGVIAVRRVEKKDMRRIARCTGATICHSMATLGDDEDEVFDAASLGHCDLVEERRVGDWDCLFFQGVKNTKAVSLLLRGANDYMLDETERSVHDALCAVSRTLESNAVCAGGGATETALSIYLEDFARTLGTREQLAIAEFAESLLVIPKTLALNAAHDALELVTQLRAIHHACQQQTDASKQAGTDIRSRWHGLDLVKGSVRNNLLAGVLEPVETKIHAIKFATEACVTILRIDDVVKVQPEPEQEAP
eukprot:Polyplicarium_translucidae@DN1983_c0_g1_i1.p1